MYNSSGYIQAGVLFLAFGFACMHDIDQENEICDSIKKAGIDPAVISYRPFGVTSLERGLSCQQIEP